MHSLGEWRGNLGFFSMRSSFVLLRFPRACLPSRFQLDPRDAISIRNPKSQIGTRNDSRSLLRNFSQHEFAISDLRCRSILYWSCFFCLTRRNKASEESQSKRGGSFHRSRRPFLISPGRRRLSRVYLCNKRGASSSVIFSEN